MRPGAGDAERLPKGSLRVIRASILRGAFLRFSAPFRYFFNPHPAPRTPHPATRNPPCVSLYPVLSTSDASPPTPNLPNVMPPFARKAWFFPVFSVLFAASAWASPDTEDRLHQDRLRQTRPVPYDISSQDRDERAPDTLRSRADSRRGRSAAEPVLLGGDFSYINEMEECGGMYRENGETVDPFALFAERGANLARVRLWHTPPTRYSAFPDAQRTIRRAKEAGMQVLLDFHYSDHWADPGKQAPPAAWDGLTIDGLRDSVYAYTYGVLDRLAEEDLLPEMVQIGNEINPGFLLPHGSRDRWPQLSRLLNAGIRAVRDVAGEREIPIDVMLHVAQPEHAMSWFAEAARAGVEDYDAMGVSYYSQWSSVPLEGLSSRIEALVSSFAPRDLLVVETAYPWTLANVDQANNILGQDALEPGYPATPAGQKAYLTDMTQAVFDGGGVGVAYWEPAWVSTPCSTLWGRGSHWENATFFDFNAGNEVLPGIDFIRHPYDFPEGRTGPLGPVFSERVELPVSVELSGNYPNPFNPGTIIEYALPRTAAVRLAVYDLLGREVALLADGVRQAANHRVRFDGSGLPSGIYLYRLEISGQVLTRRMIFLK